MINLSDKLTAKTIDHVVADSHEIEYEKGKTTTKGNTVADELTNLAQQVHNQHQQWQFYDIAIDSDRGVLRIGGNMYKLISYEGEADFDEYFDASVFVSGTTEINNPEYQSVILDNEDKVLYGKYVDDTETDIDLTGYTMVDPTTGKTVKLQLIINQLKG